MKTFVLSLVTAFTFVIPVSAFAAETTPPPNCVTLYDLPNFKGASKTICKNTPNLGGFDNRASSLKIGSNLKKEIDKGYENTNVDLWLYQDVNYKKNPIQLDSKDIPNLSKYHMDNVVSSISITKLAK